MAETLAIAGIIWLATLSPGANFAVVSRNSSLHGRAAGVASSVGIALSCWLHIGVAIFGLGLIRITLPGALDIIQVAGAAYLVWLGGSTVLSPPRPGTAAAAAPAGSASGFLANGLLTNGLNAMTLVFVISLYTQVIDPATPLHEQLLWGLVVSGAHLLWFLAVSLLMSMPAVRQRVLARERLFNALIGTILALLGGLLLMADGPATA